MKEEIIFLDDLLEKESKEFLESIPEIEPKEKPPISLNSVSDFLDINIEAWEEITSMVECAENKIISKEKALEYILEIAHSVIWISNPVRDGAK